jgi:uncharacterized protein YneF (UPF0154 family)
MQFVIIVLAILCGTIVVLAITNRRDLNDMRRTMPKLPPIPEDMLRRREDSSTMQEDTDDTENGARRD